MSKQVPEFINEQYGRESIYIPGNETAALLVHGFTAAPSEVKLLGEFLHEKKNYTISCPLLPGHGTKPEELNHTSYTAWTDCIHAEYKRLRSAHKHVIVGGESLGGLISLRLAELEPDIDALLLYAPALRAKNVWAAPIARHFIKFLYKEPKDPRIPASGYNCYPLNAVHEMIKLQRETARDLNLISQPGLLVLTDLDTMVPQTVTKEIKSKIGSKILEHLQLHQSSHIILLDMEREFVFKKSLEFLESTLNL